MQVSTLFLPSSSLPLQSLCLLQSIFSFFFFFLLSTPTCLQLSLLLLAAMFFCHVALFLHYFSVAYSYLQLAILQYYCRVLSASDLLLLFFMQQLLQFAFFLFSSFFLSDSAPSFAWQLLTVIFPLFVWWSQRAS